MIHPATGSEHRANGRWTAQCHNPGPFPGNRALAELSRSQIRSRKIEPAISNRGRSDSHGRTWLSFLGFWIRRWTRLSPRRVQHRPESVEITSLGVALGRSDIAAFAKLVPRIDQHDALGRR